MDVLVEAERRFTKKLCDCMIPYMVKAFLEMYEEAKLKEKKVTEEFQNILKAIKNWTHASVNHTDAITAACPLFPKLLAAVFVIHVKILMNGIRTNKNPKKVNIKLPADYVFVQKCFQSCGENLYYDPLIFVNPSTEEQRLTQLTDRFTSRINTVIDSLVPWESIIGDMGDEAQFNDDPDPEPEEPPAEEEPAPMELPQDAEGGELEQEPDQPPAPPVGGPAITTTPEGSKYVQVTPNLKPPSSANLFDDAPDRQKI